MEAKGFLTDSYRVSLDIEGFDYVVDQSEERGGENTGVPPHGMMLGSVAACKLQVAKGYLDYNKIAYKKVDVEASSKLNGPKRHETIEIDVLIKVHGANLNEKDIKNMTIIVENGCTMANVLTAGGENTVTTTVQPA